MADLGEGPGEARPPLILGKKKKEMTERKMAAMARKSRPPPPPPPLAQGLDPPMDMVEQEAIEKGHDLLKEHEIKM